MSIHHVKYYLKTSHIALLVPVVLSMRIQVPVHTKKSPEILGSHRMLSGV